MPKLRRSMLFLPGANAAMLSTSFIYQPDAIMFDLEDAVAVKEKESARLLVAHTLQLGIYQQMGIETVVRINALDTPFGLADLEAVVCAGVDVIRLPMTHSAQDIHQLVAHLGRLEHQFNRNQAPTKIIAAIESAQGVVNALAIATASPRMIGIALAAFDYLVDMQTERGDGQELFYARCAVLHAARVAKIAAFDVVYANINDDEGFLREVKLCKQLGFDGKSLINPRQIALLHHAYAPSQLEVDQAHQIIAAALAGEKQGLGVISLNGKMIDAPIITRAKRVIELAQLSGVAQTR